MTVDYVTGRLMSEFPENAPEAKANLIEEHGNQAFHAAWVKVQFEPDEKFYPALMAELEESKAMAT